MIQVTDSSSNSSCEIPMACICSTRLHFGGRKYRLFFAPLCCDRLRVGTYMTPTRREFLVSAAAVAAGTASRPNLLYVFSDEHRACSMPGELFNAASTPNLDRFSRQSMTFRNCISNYPVCSPYRAMLQTGRWPYQTGIIYNALPLHPDEVSIGETFRRAGYRTGYIGKWHLSPHDEGGEFIPQGPARLGYEDWHVWSNTNEHFDKSYTFDPDTGRKIQPSGITPR